MRHLLFSIFLYITIGIANSQELTYQKPDYDLIKTEIQDSSSAFYYPKIMSRLLVYDTTLTIEDYRHLYYGYIFQNDYKPYWTSPDEEKLLKYYRSKKIKEKDYDEVIKLATHSISQFPFDLRQMNFLGYIYHLMGNEEMALKVSNRFQGTIGAILSTGDGRSCQTGFHVISVSHEYVILNLFQFQMKSQAFSGDCDYLTLEKDQRNIDGLYFNIKKLFDKNIENYMNK